MTRAQSLDAGKMLVASIQVGLPRHHGVDGAADAMDRPWYSGFFKVPVEGPVWLGRTQLAGDGQADMRNHGGPDKAALAYAARHYPAWREELYLPDLPHGGFGENFTILGLTEKDVCVGDTFAIGEARVQVSQPRQPCWKLARRWRLKDLPARVVASGRTGWYFRVLAEGHVEAGQPVLLLERPFPTWTIDRANKVMHQDPVDRASAAELAAIPLLSETWRRALAGFSLFQTRKKVK
jgi:MOSC domain-containing protein YiiM